MVRALAIEGWLAMARRVVPYCGTHDLSTERIYLDWVSTVLQATMLVVSAATQAAMTACTSTGGRPFGADSRFLLSLIGN